ncbi:MAG: VCBS repeat-containing protein [Planctomycetota bacterium]|nr:VCBS repeat-containing protein [Planctomycetota bacterium]
MRNALHGWGTLACGALCVSLTGAQDFGPEQVLSAAEDGVLRVLAADLDGDGDADIVAAAYYANELFWHENLGAGLFGAKQLIPIDMISIYGAHAADLDGDGDQDLIAACPNSKKIAWFENLGSGSFGPQQAISTGVQAGSINVHAADLDGDGDVDVLAVGAADDTVAWYENDGSGSFGALQLISTSVDFPVCVYTKDLDGDGDEDVISASVWDDKVAWYENNGSGSFGPQRVITLAANGATCVLAMDLSGDGVPDVLVASQEDDTISWYESIGWGTFGPRQVITSTAKRAYGVHAADLDLDGDADVLSASDEDDTIAWYENVGWGNGVNGGHFGPKQTITTSADGARCVVATDLNGDGYPDVLAASYLDDTLAWYENLMGGSAQCNVVFCDTDAANIGDVTLSTCDCSGGSITLDLSTTFTGKFTYPLVGLGTTAVSPTGVSELCLAGSPIGRYNKDAGAISVSGTYSVDLLNAVSAPGGGVPTIGGALCNGNTWRFQYWHRDGMNPSRFSKGISGLIN